MVCVVCVCVCVCSLNEIVVLDFLSRDIYSLIAPFPDHCHFTSTTNFTIIGPLVSEKTKFFTLVFKLP